MGMPSKKRPRKVDGDETRPMPKSLEAEKSVVGGLLVCGANGIAGKAFAQVSPFVDAGDFFSSIHASIYQAQIDLIGSGKPVDPLTVAEQMRANDTFLKLRAVEGEAYLHLLMSQVVTVENIAHHAKIVREKSLQRRMIEVAQEISARGFADYGDLEEYFKTAEQSVALVLKQRELPGAEALLPMLRIADVEDPGAARWLVEGLWMQGAFGFVGGEAKSQKSFLTLWLAVHIAAGLPVWERPVAQGRVLVVSVEGGPSLVRSRVGGMCQALNVDIGDLELSVVDVPGLRIDDAGELARLLATIRKFRPRLLILDPFRDLFAGDEDNAGVVAQLVAPLRELAAEIDCAIMIVHHMGKAGESTKGRRLGQRLRGSSALHGVTDSALYLAPSSDAPDRFINVVPEHRAAAPQQPLRFRVVDVAGALTLNLVSEADEAVAKVNNDEMRVLEAVQKAGEKGINATALRGALKGMGRRRIEGALEALIDDQIRNIGKPNRPLYRAIEHAPPDLFEEAQNA